MEGAKAIVTVSLKQATAAAALRFMSGEGLAAGEGPADALAGEVLRAMFLGQMNSRGKVRDAAGAGRSCAAGWPGQGRRPPCPLLADGRDPCGQRSRTAGPGGAKQEESPFRMTGTVRVEGTGEPVAGARVQVDLGSKDFGGDFREAVTDAEGWYTIPLPEGNARPLFFSPPPGYWLPEPARHCQFFAVTPQQPVYRKDYEVRRGTAWTFRLTRGPSRSRSCRGSFPPITSRAISASPSGRRPIPGVMPPSRCPTRRPD